MDIAVNTEAVKARRRGNHFSQYRQLEEAVKDIAPFISPEQIVIDITSIKGGPVEVMHKYLPTAAILGTHPLFGPGAEEPGQSEFRLDPYNRKRKNAGRKSDEIPAGTGLRG